MEPEEQEYGSSDSKEYTRTWCSSDVFLQGGARSQEDVDAELSEERTAKLEEHVVSQGEAQMEDEEEVPKHVGMPSMNKTLKRFAAVSDLVAAEPTASATKRRQVPPVPSAAKKAVADCQEAPKKRAVGCPADKAGSRVNSGSRASSVAKDTSPGRSSHALHAAGRKRNIKEIIPAKFR